jgi:hypothetical protein
LKTNEFLSNLTSVKYTEIVDAPRFSNNPRAPPSKEFENDSASMVANGKFPI